MLSITMKMMKKNLRMLIPAGIAILIGTAFIAAIRAMNARMGIPGHLDVIREEDIPQMVAWALREANPTYPVPVLYDEAHCAEVIRRVRG